MSENRRRSYRKQEIKRNSNTKKRAPTSSETYLAGDWLEDLDGYQSVLQRITQGKKIEC